MSAGFKSPSILLGISSSPSSSGVRSLVAPWIGGASSIGAERGSFRSMVAPWLGGASVSPSNRGGFKSFCYLWGGGAGCRPVTPPTPPVVITESSRGTQREIQRKKRFIKRDKQEIEILNILSVVIGNINC